mmetsp:Transcript_120066/g.268331  ORF Transcript_120066/g.268331 Transcript_120066/m.268331 type:complete len:253 (-) Transcript_120066:201-959(-)
MAAVPAGLRSRGRGCFAAEPHFHEAAQRQRVPPPPRDRFHKSAVPDEDWWLRCNDRSRERTDGAYTYFPEGSMLRSNFGAEALALQGDHARRVFGELARQGHSFSEGNLWAVRTDAKIRRRVQRRYGRVMRSAPGPPGIPRPMLQKPDSDGGSTRPSSACSSSRPPSASQGHRSHSACPGSRPLSACSETGQQQAKVAEASAMPKAGAPQVSSEEALGALPASRALSRPSSAGSRSTRSSRVVSVGQMSWMM